MTRRNLVTNPADLPADGEVPVYDDATDTWSHIPLASALSGVTVTGTPSVGATLVATSATTAQWVGGAAAVTIYWPSLLVLSSAT